MHELLDYEGSDDWLEGHSRQELTKLATSTTVSLGGTALMALSLVDLWFETEVMLLNT